MPANAAKHRAESLLKHRKVAYAGRGMLLESDAGTISLGYRASCVLFCNKQFLFSVKLQCRRGGRTETRPFCLPEIRKRVLKKKPKTKGFSKWSSGEAWGSAGRGSKAR